MRFLIQRVTRASVSVDNQIAGEIGNGLLVFIGVGANDQPRDADTLAQKLVNLRIFPDAQRPDAQDRMNLNALEARAELLLVSQFTLYGDCRKGRRPSFDAAAPPARARELYEYTVDQVRAHGLTTRTGVFQAHMRVELVNDGPVTFMLES